ncbi:hypothetical protein LCGC14_1109990 [marine sediment metagenome]|uniref:Uncharacterized protein n=1 Tax=marine sediment metagenome TaxID=412755 RepID=A0A0F9M6X9_9ZZZZ
MKEIIQLNLTEEESIILQSLVAVGITTRHENLTIEVLEDLERRVCSMRTFLRSWPEASKSLAEKMTDLTKTSMEMIKAKC